MQEVSSWVVVVVDNDMFNLDIAAQMLELFDATVHTADSGEKGLELLDQIKPTFMLLDLSMPNMDGWEVLKVIRTKPALDYLPVIALTAHAMAGDEQRALSAGFDGYITKPFKVENLVDDIQVILTKIQRPAKSEDVPAITPQPEPVAEVAVISGIREQSVGEPIEKPQP